MLPQQKPIEVQLTNLDTQMKEILENRTLPVDIKHKLYTHVLHQYGELRGESRKPVEIPFKRVGRVQEPVAPSVPATAAASAAEEELGGEIPHGDLMKNIPNYKKENGRNLLDFLQTLQDFKWNSKKELIIDGKTIPGSNLLDVFEYTTRDKTRGPPVGWQQFYDFLLKKNVPKSAIGNRSLVNSPKPRTLVFKASPKSTTPKSAPAATRNQRGRGGKYVGIY